MKNIHILPTAGPSRLIVYSTILSEYRLLDKPILDWKHKKHIYITNDEEIKDGDWCLYFNRFGSKIVCKAKLTDTGFVYQELGEDYIGREDEGITPLKSEISKIILTIDLDLVTDGVQAIDDEFLQWFVQNPSCEFVEIEKGMFFESDNYHFYKIIIPERGFTITQQKSLQLNKEFIDNTTTKDLDKLMSDFDELNQETIEEAAKKQWGNVHRTGVLGFIDGATWQEQRMYSEEEVLELLLNCRGENPIDVEEWFEQFKKK